MQIKKYSISEILTEFLLKPFFTGLYGFAGFFLVILISKYFSTLIGISETWTVGLSDVTLSLLGFFFLFLINLLKNVQKFQSEKTDSDSNIYDY